MKRKCRSNGCRRRPIAECLICFRVRTTFWCEEHAFGHPCMFQTDAVIAARMERAEEHTRRSRKARP